MKRNTDLLTKGCNSVFYNCWNRMLNRCYSKSVLKTQPYYLNCRVIEQWWTFSIFKSWMEKQEWKGCVLDKDILGDGNIYSPNTCAFILPKTNSFVTDRNNYRGLYPIGVHKHCSGKFQARVGDGSGNRIHLGSFSCPYEAHLQWLLYKQKIAIELASLEKDVRVKEHLIKRYEFGGRYDQYSCR